MRRTYANRIAAVVTALALMAPVTSWAESHEGNQDADSPGAGAIVVDLLIGRPTLLMATIAGAAFYGISLPITIPSGTEKDARNAFLVPAEQFAKTPLGGALRPKS